MTVDKKTTKKSFTKKFFKYFLLLFLFLFITLSSLIILIPRIEFLQEQLASKVEYFLKDQFIADLKIGKINFKNYDEIEISEILLYTKGDTLAYIPKLELEFNFKQLISKNIHIKKLKLHNSVFKMLRSKDSTWNYEYIVLIEDDNDTTTSKTPILNLKNLELKNCRFVMLDSLDSTSYKDKLNFSNINLSNLNTKINGNIDIDNLEHTYEILNLSFIENNSNLNLSYLKANKIRFTENKSTVDGLSMEVNDSKIDCFVETNNFSPISFNEDDLYKMQSNISVKSQNFNSDLVNLFIDSLFNKNQIFELDLKANGNLKNAIVNNLSLKNKGLDLKISSRLKDFTNDEKLKYTISFDNSFVNFSYLKKISKINLNDIPDLKLTYINKFESEGNVSSHNAQYDIISALGNFNGNSSINLNSEEYSTNTNFSNLNLNMISSDLSNSNLNGSVNLNGKNLDISKMSGNFILSINNSVVESKNIDTLLISSDFELGNIKINEFSYKTKNSNANILGSVDLKNLDSIKYDLNISSNNLDLTFINSDLPKKISSEIKLKGVGVDIENMKLDADIKLKELLIDEYQIKYFDFYIYADNSTKKKMYFNSEDVNIKIDGDFKFEELIEVFINEYEYIYHDIEIISNHINKIDNNDDIKFIENYPEINADFSLDIKSLKKFKDFIPIDLNFNSEIKINLNSSDKNLKLTSNQIHLNNFKIRENDLDIKSNMLDFKINYVKNLNLENPIEKLNLGLYTNMIDYNELNIKNLDYNFDIINNKVISKLNAKLLDSISIINNLTIINPKENEYDIKVDSLNLTLGKYNTYYNKAPIDFVIIDDDIKTSNFTINSLNDEKIDFIFDFELTNMYLNEFDLKFSNFNFNNINYFYSDEYLKSLEGELSEVNLKLKSNLSNPIGSITFNGDKLKYNNISIGKIDSEIRYADKNLFGEFKIGDKSHNLNIFSKRFPLLLNLEKGDFSFDNNKEFDVNIELSKLEAGLVEPFLPVIYNLQGFINSKISIKGTLDKGIDYRGDLTLNDGSFIVEPTNIMYDFNAKINIDNDKFTLFDTKVKNRKQDLRNGQADVTGYLKMDGFDFEYFEFEVKSNQFKVMREETKLVSPDLYGEMVIATGQTPLVFSGNFDYPKLKGDVDILDSKLTMPSELASQFVESKLEYKIIDNTVKITVKDTIEAEKKEISEDFLDILALDLNLRFIGDLEMFIELNAITEMKIFLGTKYKEEIVVFEKGRKENDAQLIGNIVLKDDSFLTFLGKRFDTTGEISFPTGEISNPTLDILSKYSNFTSNGVPFEVLINITGTKDEPELDFSYIYNNIKANEDKEDMKQNAFSLLALNMLKNDALGDQNQNPNLQGEAVNIGNSILSNLATKNLNEALLDYGINAAIDIDVNNPDQSVVKLQGKLSTNNSFLKDIKWTVGGNISNLESNQISIEIPLGVFSYLQLSRPNNPFIVKENQVEWEGKLRFGKTW